MPSIPEGFGQATLVFTIPGPGSPAMVVFGFEDNPIQDPDAQAGFIAEAWNATGSMSTNVDSGATQTECRVLIRRGGELVAGLDTEATVQLNSGTAAPPQVALLFQKQTGFAGRNRRGRLYSPAPSAVPETGQFPTSTLDLINPRSANFLVLLASAGNPMYLLHVNPADTPNIVTALVAQATVATQRRRIR